MAAMIYRCKELGILNPDQMKYLWKQMNVRGIRKKEPLDNAFALSRPTVLASAAAAASSISDIRPGYLCDGSRSRRTAD